MSHRQTAPRLWTFERPTTSSIPVMDGQYLSSLEGEQSFDQSITVVRIDGLRPTPNVLTLRPVHCRLYARHSARSVAVSPLSGPSDLQRCCPPLHTARLQGRPGPSSRAQGARARAAALPTRSLVKSARCEALGGTRGDGYTRVCVEYLLSASAPGRVRHARRCLHYRSRNAALQAQAARAQRPSQETPVRSRLRIRLLVSSELPRHPAALPHAPTALAAHLPPPGRRAPPLGNQPRRSDTKRAR